MNKILRNAVLLAAVISAIEALKWVDCGSSKAKISKVSVTDCDSTPACTLKRGGTYTISVDFVPSEDITSAKTVVYGVLPHVPIPIPFPIANPDACNKSGLACPVKSGTPVSYHSDIYVKKSYPSIKVIVKWEVKDQNNKDLVCITLPAQITAGDKTIDHPNHLQREDKDTYLRYKSLH